MDLEAEYVSFLDCVYGAAFEPDGFAGAITRFADLTGAAKAWMPTLSLTDNSGTGVLARIDPGRQDAYFAYYAGVNPFLTEGPSPTLRHPWPLRPARPAW